MQREFKVNVTETIVRQMWVLADDPQEALEMAEGAFSSEEIVDVSYDVDPTEWRERDSEG